MRPYIIIFSTTTIDGRIASKDYYSELSCPYDKMRLHILRTEVDAVLVGSNTVRIDNPKLLVKYAKGRNPVRVTISESLNFDPNLNIFSVPPDTIIYTTYQAYLRNEDKANELKKKGVKIRVLEKLSSCIIAEDLYNLGVKRILIEGGGRTIWNFIKDNCFDEIRITISPKIFGNGVSVVNGEGFKGIEAPELKLVDCKICECKKEIHLRYMRL
ncbi:2,5-diamino-6-(ribosylamino)-4(3H)-pyrimidinone 5'-phosphate reductase [Sulfurisphaera tokodaii]|uniref:2,5-diamino-6-(ribosylamino)-4(3H)-pyrimidinone 5'-phosphate reductase n=2 Tax=Sulfurisphaera tokodaii TaxID=111955 RepID=Q975Z3_SULTO|nr:2,5-diamino-6-(ribosylamino)-4(3H)-pyrimidinone 5'-phosphate reductase [Sulfurisphaera tokodaii]BAB65255.1 2,5-diamino-6-ribosylamino-4(3H)-pyrimidinone 5'-phosphate reductase [Sulfurisphaera tokodaii str. 7]HII75044.1 2,5-diamino-6-(ribosylamino)-4(3H)-pyrimidinone 5'-phosphate reductase [Sulfurisphaera tokodaii]